MESYFKHKGLGDAARRGAAIEVGALNFFDPCPRGALGSRFPPSRASILIIPSAIVSRDPSNRIFFFLIIIFTHLSPATSPQLARRFTSRLIKLDNAFSRIRCHGVKFQ